MNVIDFTLCVYLNYWKSEVIFVKKSDNMDDNKNALLSLTNIFLFSLLLALSFILTKVHSTTLQLFLKYRN